MSDPLALIIEDDSYISEVFAKAFRKEGFAVEIIEDGTLAQQRLAEVTPAAIALDLHLPGMSGVELFRHMRADARFARTYIAIVTGDPYLANTLRREAEAVYIKPIGYIEMRDLAARIKQKSSL